MECVYVNLDLCHIVTYDNRPVFDTKPTIPIESSLTTLLSRRHPSSPNFLGDIKQIRPLQINDDLTIAKKTTNISPDEFIIIDIQPDKHLTVESGIHSITEILSDLPVIDSFPNNQKEEITFQPNASPLVNLFTVVSPLQNQKPIYVNPINPTTFYEPQPTDAKPCPWCGRYCDKDAACNHVVCGVGSQYQDPTHQPIQPFRIGEGCGRQFCFQCGKKLCGLVYNLDGSPTGASQNHAFGQHVPTIDDPCDGPNYCPGGHNSHK